MTTQIVPGLQSHYGTMESNGLVNGPKYHEDNANNQHPDFPGVCDWTEPELKVTRLRLLSDPGFPFWDVSYCDGELDGYYVRVQLPFNQLKKRNVTGQIIEYAKRDKVFAKGLGILNCGSTLC